MESLGDRDSKKTEEALEAKTPGLGEYPERAAGSMEQSIVGLPHFGAVLISAGA
jgi:hypothetical protein